MRRKLSLYYATIGPMQAAQLLLAWLASPFISAACRRVRMANAVRKWFPESEVFLFSSARGALAACLKASGIGQGDDVLLSAYTCIAVPTAVVAVGAKPVYADVDPRTLNTPADVAIVALGPNVRAAVVQHTLGCPAEVEAIASEARRRDILVIEDCALSLGATREGRPLGSFADAAIYSLELSKTLTVGWGGVLVVNRAALKAKVGAFYASVDDPDVLSTTRKAWQAAISGLCFQPSIYLIGQFVVAAAFLLGVFGRSTSPSEERGHVAPDFIRRLAGPQAALGASQWERLTCVATACRDNSGRLRDTLATLGYFPLSSPVRDSDVVVTPRVSFLVSDRQAAVRWFRAAGIELGQWFDGPLSPLPEGVTPFNYDLENYPHAAFVAAHVVNLPSHSRLSSSDLDHIVETLTRYAEAHPEDRALSARIAGLAATA